MSCDNTPLSDSNTQIKIVISLTASPLSLDSSQSSLNGDVCTISTADFQMRFNGITDDGLCVLTRKQFLSQKHG